MKKKIAIIIVFMLLATSVLAMEINAEEKSYVKEKIESVIF